MSARSRLRMWMQGLAHRHGTRTLLILALIVAVGLGLRARQALDPLANPGADARAYFSLSKALYVDGTYGGPSFHNASDWSPGAPLLYAGVYYATGGVRDGAARMVVALLGAATIVIAYLLARRLAGGAAGLLAAAGVALYPSFIHSTGALLSEPPAILTLPAAVLALLWARQRRSAWAWALPGALLGLTALIRPEYLLVGLAFVLVVLINAGRARGWRLGAGSAALLLTGFLAPIIPWTIHNLVSLDRFVPISTGGGKALYVGTYLPADGDYQRVKADLVKRFEGRRLQPGSPQLDAVNPTPLFDRIAAQHPNLPRDTSLGRIGKHQLFHYLEQQPLDYLAMLGRKTARMWDRGVAMGGTAGRALQLLLVALGLGGLGALAWRRRWWELLVFAIPIAAVTAIGAVTLASTRRNEVLMSLLIPLAAAALDWGWSSLHAGLRARRVRRPLGVT